MLPRNLAEQVLTACIETLEKRILFAAQKKEPTDSLVDAKSIIEETIGRLVEKPPRKPRDSR